MRCRWSIAFFWIILLFGEGLAHAGLFDTPEVRVAASPPEARSLAMGEGERAVDCDVSPGGAKAAILVKDSKGRYLVRFWLLDGSKPVESWEVPRALTPRSIAWHPLGNAFFLSGGIGAQHVIVKIAEVSGHWKEGAIYRTSREIRRLVLGPRPFVVGYDERNNKEIESYRLFFGMKNEDGSYSIRCVTEDGKREYQVVGPKSGLTRFRDSEARPSEIQAHWALPIGFHPAGHLLLWEDEQHVFQVARYDRDSWTESRTLFDGSFRGGTVTATSNGLGLLHWRPETDGVTVICDHGRRKTVQAAGYRFLFTPSSVPDGRGVVGVVRKDGNYAVVFVPIEVPLADVANAWMFVESPGDTDLIGRKGGLLRGLQLEQLYSLYDTEAYYCGGYDRSTPTRPYLVTTDIFWELLAAAYEGLFIVTERRQAVPAFWDFVEALDRHFHAVRPGSPWEEVLVTLKHLHASLAPDATDREVQLILRAQGREKSPSLGVELDYGELLPRGHYASDPELQIYFKAFKYLTELAPEAAPVEALRDLPEEVRAKALSWILPYRLFIAPPRAPLVWDSRSRDLPAYARHPVKEQRLFPLSWGFDNEVLLSTVFHPSWPEAEQITGPLGPRITPSGLDVAAAIGSDFALGLLKKDLAGYPRLRAVIQGLRSRAPTGGGRAAQRDLYSRWIDALAIQWADQTMSPNGPLDEALWHTKRLQTGLASWATLRHATVLVNERTTAECGEAGFEPIILQPPRGYVEPDPPTFEAIAGMFDCLLKLVNASGELLQADHLPSDSGVPAEEGSEEEEGVGKSGEMEPLRRGIARRLAATAEMARLFKRMAEKEIGREELSNEDYEKILHINRVAEHHFLVYMSLANKDFALSNPDPMAKIVDVAGGGPLNIPYLMAAVGNPLEWNHVVPFYGRKEIVKGSVYSYYEFVSERLLDDAAWRKMLPGQARPNWIEPFVSHETASYPPRYPY